MKIQRLKRIAHKRLAEHRHAQRTLKAERIALHSYKEAQHAAIEAQQTVQKLAAEIQTEAHQQITRVVTSALRYVFRKSYTFQISFLRRRGKTEARLLYRYRGHDIDPITEDGGGLLDISAFALRISAITLETPQRRKFLALDEPFKAINGEEFRQRTAELVAYLSKNYGVQILIASGLDWLCPAGKVIPI